MTLYNCKPDAHSYRVTKFTADLEVESSYLTSADSCECPAGHRHTCRHRQMLPLFEAKGATRGQWFLDFDRKTWIRAIGEEDSEAPTAYQESTVPASNLTATEVDERIANYSGPIPGDGWVEAVVGHAFSMLDLANPAAVHNAIAEAVGEPKIEAKPTSFLRRI